MNVEAEVSRFCFFDLHFVAAPTRNPALFQPAVSFLGKPDEFEKAHATAWRIDASTITLRPMGAALEWSHFWKGLLTLCTVEGTDQKYPHYHRPVEAVLRDFKVVVKLPDVGAEINARVRLLVWPYAWSTQIQLSLPTVVSLPSLLNASAALRNEPVYELRSTSGSVPKTNQTLSNVFREIATRVQSSLYVGAVGEERPINRQTVICLSRFGEAASKFTYSAEIDPEEPSLPTADRARLHGTLLGHVVPLNELLKRESVSAPSARSFLLIPLRARGFAIAEFNVGVLLLFQESAPRTGTGTTVARCLCRNTASMITVTHALMSADAKLRVKPPNWLNESADWAAKILTSLPKYYDNIVCRRIFEHHSGIKAVVSRQ